MKKGDIFTSWESYREKLASHWALIWRVPQRHLALWHFSSPASSYYLFPTLLTQSISPIPSNWVSQQPELQKATILPKGNLLISHGKQRHEANKQVFSTLPLLNTIFTIFLRERGGEVFEKPGLAISTCQTLTCLARHPKWQPACTTKKKF